MTVWKSQLESQHLIGVPPTLPDRLSRLSIHTQNLPIGEITHTLFLSSLYLHPIPTQLIRPKVNEQVYR